MNALEHIHNTHLVNPSLSLSVPVYNVSKDKDALSVTPLDAAKVALGVAKVLVKASPISQVSILVDTAELILKIIEVRMVFASLRLLSTSQR